MTRRDGIDVSRYQGAVDWQTVRAQGMDWSAWKATQGTRWVDPFHPRNREGTAAAGFPVRLMYHWLDHETPASQQAAHFIRTVGALAPGEGVMLDAEEDGITLGMAVEWCDAVEAALGRPVAVYTGVYVAGGTLWRSERLFNGTRPRVLAAYTSEAKARRLSAPYAWDAWQWTGSGRVPGVGPEVDIDQVDDMDAFRAICGYTTTPEEDDSMRYCIINVAGTRTKLIGQRDGAGLIFDAEWSGPGSDQTVQSRLGLLRKNGAPELDLAPTSLYLVTLHGPVPEGDPDYDWTGDEFFRVVGA